MFTFCFLFLRGRRHQSTLLRALLGEHVISTRVINQALVFEMQNTADRAVQKLAVVADDQNSVRVFDEVRLKPKCALKIKVVCRFVEQQQIRFREKDSRQSDTHTPTA